MWQAFGGYQQIYGELPPVHKVRRIRLYLTAKAEYESEQAKESKAKQAEQEAELARQKAFMK